MPIDLEQILGSPWVYLVLVALILSDVYLPVLPSGTSLITATVFAVDGPNSLVGLLLCAAAASTLGDGLAFAVARKASGRLRRLVSRFSVTNRLDGRMRGTMRQYPVRTVVFARFVPAGRCVVTFTSGSDPEIPLNRFWPASALAALCWAGYTVGLGVLNAWLFNTGLLAVVVAVATMTAVGWLLARTRPAAALAGLAQL